MVQHRLQDRDLTNARDHTGGVPDQYRTSIWRDLPCSIMAGSGQHGWLLVYIAGQCIAARISLPLSLFESSELSSSAAVRVCRSFDIVASYRAQCGHFWSAWPCWLWGQDLLRLLFRLKVSVTSCGVRRAARVAIVHW